MVYTFHVDQQTRRYIDLVEGLGREMKKKRGWQRRVAGLLDVHPSYISRLLTGRLDVVGDDVVRRARERLGLPSNYFDEHAGDADREVLADALRQAVEQKTHALGGLKAVAALLDEGRPDGSLVRLLTMAAQVHEHAGDAGLAAATKAAGAAAVEARAELARTVARDVLSLRIFRMASDVLNEDHTETEVGDLGDLLVYQLVIEARAILRDLSIGENGSQ